MASQNPGPGNAHFMLVESLAVLQAEAYLLHVRFAQVLQISGLLCHKVQLQCAPPQRRCQVSVELVRLMTLHCQAPLAASCRARAFSLR